MAWFARPRDREQIRPLVELTEQFLLGELDAAAYDVRYREAFHVADGLAEDLFLIVDSLFMACEAYVEDPGLRDHEWDLDEDALRAAAVRTLARLAIA